jgi:hypothetical protein
MQAKNLVNLILITILAVIITAFAIITSPKYQQNENVGKKVFPKLIRNINNVSYIKIKKFDYELDIKKQDEQWVLEQMNNYPVKEKRIRNILVGLSQMQYLEPKTKNEKRYKKIQLNSPEIKGSKSRRITVYDNNKNILADVIIGLKKLNLKQAGEAIYFRKGNEKQSWLGKTNLDATGDKYLWLKMPILDIDGNQIEQAKITAPNGKTFIAKREKIGVEFLPGNKKIPLSLSVRNELNDLKNSLNNLGFTDVKKDEDNIFSKDKNYYETQIKTFDGLTIIIKAREFDGRYWAKFEAQTDRITTKKAKETKERINSFNKNWIYKLKIKRIRPFMNIIADPKI